MEEQFRNWRPTQTIRIKYKDEQRITRIWETDQYFLIKKIKKIVHSYFDIQDLTLSQRQLYYQLVKNTIIPNAQEVYKRVCKLVTDLRYAGEIDWDAIEDRGRVPKKHSEWDNVKRLVESAVASYRLPRWSDQEYYLEFYCEKEAMEKILRPVADKWHIHFGYNKGYSSSSTIYDIAQRIKEQIRNGKQCVILYLGDHDPSGLDMIRDIRNRIDEFLTGGEDPISFDYDDFDVVQLALNMEQIKQFKPPPNPAKITDPRAKQYIKKYGNVSWELDALDPETLVGISEDGILRYLDISKYKKWVEREIKEIKELKEFGERMSNGD